jgi:hypothetical protein
VRRCNPPDLCSGDRVAERRNPDRAGTVRAVNPDYVTVKWDDASGYLDPVYLYRASKLMLIEHGDEWKALPWNRTPASARA